MKKGATETDNTEPQKSIVRWAILGAGVIVVGAVVWYIASWSSTTQAPPPSASNPPAPPQTTVYRDSFPDKSIGSVSASAQAGTHDVNRAFDGSNAPDSFWEVGPFPVECNIILKGSHIVEGYSVVGGENWDRMPTEWTLRGSADGKTWQTLDHRALAQVWKAGQIQSFKVENSPSVQMLKFTFEKGTTPGGFRIYDLRLSLR